MLVTDAIEIHNVLQLTGELGDLLRCPANESLGVEKGVNLVKDLTSVSRIYLQLQVVYLPARRRASA